MSNHKPQIKIVGITGPIGHGKSTFAEMLRHLEKDAFHIESSDLVAEVADVWQTNLLTTPEPNDIESINTAIRLLPGIIKGKLNADASYDKLALTRQAVQNHPEQFEKLFTYFGQLAADYRLAEQKINRANKDDYRSLLQWLGGYLVLKVGPGIWYNEIARQIQVIADRKSLAVVGGLRYPNDAKILKQIGGVIVRIERPGISDPFITDLTEQQRGSIPSDCVVINNGTIADLKKCAQELLTDLQNNQLKTEYIARI